MQSQSEAILKYLKRGRKLTALQALDKFDCWSLRSRISDLRRRGHNIVTEMIELQSGKRVARYSL